MKRTIAVMAMLAVCAAVVLAQCPGGACPAGEACQPGGTMSGKCDMPAMSGQRPWGMGQGMMGQGPGHCCTTPEMVKELGLSDDQVKKIDDLALKHRTAMIKMAADLEIARLEMQDLVGSGAGDSDIRGKAKAISSIRQKIEDSRLEHMLDCRKLLSAEQRKQFKTLCPPMHKQGMMDCCPEGQGHPNR